MLAGSLFLSVSCAKRDENDKGATLLMYLTADPSNLNLDPAKMIYSHEAIKLMGLIFEGLMKYDENGKLTYGMAKSYTKIHDEDKGEYKLQFELKNSKWSDGIVVSADDFVYAWKRILEPDFSGPAAPLLYQIKNARLVKNGEATIDDLGVVALDTTLLEITFEPLADGSEPDYDKFIENTASIGLVPLRSDEIDRAPNDWAKKTLTLLSNGPFIIKQMEYNKATMLERSTYYFLEGKKEDDIFKYVKPYRIVLDFSKTLADIEAAYAADNFIFFLGNVPAAKYAEYKDKSETKMMMSNYSYHFNTANSLFAKAEVRKALSISLDRNKIAEIYGLGVTPATGIVPSTLTGETYKDSYREAAGDIIPVGGDAAAAKSLLSAAGVSGGSFTLKVSANEEEKKVAEYAAGVWNSLGFTVTVQEVKGVAYNDDIVNCNYDVMGYTDQALTIDAFSVLAPFAKPFSGNQVTFGDEGASVIKPYITGFQNDAYDAKIEEIFAMSNKDAAARLAALIEAEKMLVDLSPVAPLYTQASLNITDKISGLSYSKYGFTFFTKANLKNYKQYETTVEETRQTVIAQE